MRSLAVFAFLAITAGLLIFLLRFFTQFSSEGEIYTLKAVFADTGGVNEGNPIKMVGKTIGQVGDIQLHEESRGVEMELLIYEGTRIPTDSTLKVAEKGMLGEMFLSFDYGKAPSFHEPGSTIMGAAPYSLTDFMAQAGGTLKETGGVFHEIGTELKTLITNVNEVMGEQQVKGDLRKLVETLPALVSQLEQAVAENRPGLRQTLASAGNTLESTSDAMDSLKAQIQEMERRKTFERIASVVEKFDSISGNLDQLSGGPLPQIFENVDGLTQEGKQALAALQGVFSSLEPDSQGSIAKLLHDGSFIQDLHTMIVAGKDLMVLLEEQPNSLIFGKRKSKKEKKQVAPEPQPETAIETDVAKSEARQRYLLPQ